MGESISFTLTAIKANTYIVVPTNAHAYTTSEHQNKLTKNNLFPEDPSTRNFNCLRFKGKSTQLVRDP